MLLLPSGMGLCPLPWLHIPTHLLERLNLLMEKLHSPLRQPGKQKFICYWQIKRKCSIPGHLLSIRNYRNETKPQILPKPKALGCSSKYPNTFIFVMQKITLLGSLLMCYPSGALNRNSRASSQGCISAHLILMCRMKIHTCSQRKQEQLHSPVGEPGQVTPALQHQRRVEPAMAETGGEEAVRTCRSLLPQHS